MTQRSTHNLLDLPRRVAVYTLAVACFLIALPLPYGFYLFLRLAVVVGSISVIVTPPHSILSTGLRLLVFLPIGAIWMLVWELPKFVWFVLDLLALSAFFLSYESPVNPSIARRTSGQPRSRQRRPRPLQEKYRRDGKRDIESTRKRTSQPIDNFQHAMALARAGEWEKAGEQLRIALSLQHPKASKIQRTIWCPSCKRGVEEPPVSVSPGYHAYWSGKCPRCTCQLRFEVKN